jgi:DNA sulfur modification protein DndD
MLIERLRFKDFLVFRNDQTLSFSFKKGRNLTLILAPNNTGKTSIIRAIEFLLYGDTQMSALEKLPNLARTSKLEPSATAESFVEATIRDGALLYTLKRRLLFSRVAGRTPRARIHQINLDVIMHNELGDQRLPPTKDLEGIVSRFVPRVMFNFFFFKGEELAQQLLAPRPELRVLDELRRLLYQSEWEFVLDECAGAREAVGKELARLADKEDEYRAGQAKLGDVTDSMKKLKAQQDKDKASMASLEQQLAAIEAEIQNLLAASDPSAGQRLQSVRTELAKLKNRDKELDQRRRDLVGGQSVFALADLQADIVREQLGELRRRRLLPPDLSEGLLVRLLQERRCICGRPLLDDTQELDAVEQLRKCCLDEAVSNDLWILDTLTEPQNMGGFRAQRLELNRQLMELHSERQGVLDGQQALEQERERLEQAVDEDKGRILNERKSDRARCVGGLEIIKNRIQDRGHMIGLDEEESRRLQAEIRRLEVGGSKTPALTARAEICEVMENTAKLCQGSLTQKILSELRSTVSQLYDEIVTDGSSAKVNGETLLPTIERSGVTGLASGGGQAQTLVLCYLIALGKLRKTINEELKKHFNISDFREQAFFMDSVFGQMEPEYQRAVAQVLPEHIKQLVVLVARQQWGASVESGLGSRLTNTYGLELSTPMKVTPQDYQFTFEGHPIKLVKHVDAEEQAFTTIRKLG